MSELVPTEAERQRIFEERARPVLFPHEPSDSPALVFVVGQPGSGALRATARLVEGKAVAAVSVSDLGPFHPRFLDLSRSRAPEAASILNQSTTAWMQSALQHARTTRRSLVLDGTGSSPDIALATAGLFARSGFTTTVAVVAVPKAESLLAATSKYLLDARARRVSALTSVAQHNTSFDQTRDLVTSLESTPSVDRLTIIGRDGATRFDMSGAEGTAFAGATAVLDRERSSALAAPQAMRWLSELRAATDFALSGRQIERPLADALVELHEMGLREVIPRLPLPDDSQARPIAEANLSHQLAAVREAARVERRAVPQPGPVASAPVPAPAPGISR